MPETLRPIALSVEEPEPGAYRWVLYQRHAAAEWTEIQRSDDPFESYETALAVGVEHLQKTLHMGKFPIKKAPEGHLAPKAVEKVDEAPAPPKRPSVFGFGPAR